MPNLLSKLMEKPVKIDLDEKLLVPDFRDIKRIPPNVGIFDEPTRCYRINEQWAKIVMGWVKWLATMSAWVDAENDLYPAIAEILLFTIGEDCMDFQLRQSPENSCIMEQSIDGGLNWTPVFDFSLCTSIVDGSDTVISNYQYNEYFNNVFTEIYNSFVTNYIDSPDDVYPDLAYGGGMDAELDSAYCNSVYVLVSTSADVAIQGIQSLDEQQQQFNVWVSMVGFVLTAIAIAGALPTAGASLVALAGLATWWGPVVGVTAAIANKLLNQWQASQISQYQDTAAQFEVTCYIVNNLPGNQNTQASFLSFMQNHTLTGNAAVIADNLAILLESDATYAAFLEKWENNLEFANAGIALYCPCDLGTWCWEWNGGTQMALDWVAEYASGGGATFSARGSEFIPGLVTNVGTRTAQSIKLTLPANTEILAIETDTVWDVGMNGNLSYPLSYNRLQPSTGVIQRWTKAQLGSPSTFPTTITETFNGSDTLDEFRIFSGSNIGNDPALTGATTRIRITGTGTVPTFNGGSAC